MPDLSGRELDGYLPCPFCGEDDFDLIGLKVHLTAGWCQRFNALPGLRAVTIAAVEEHERGETISLEACLEELDGKDA
jgi:hypothetical protein